MQAGIDEAELISEALQCLRQRRFAEAEAICMRVLQERPKSAPALRVLGIIACQAGRLDAGIGLIRESIDIDPNDAAGYGDLGMALRIAGRLEESAQAMQQAAAKQPGAVGVHVDLGGVLTELGRWAEGEQAFRRAIALDPAHAGAYNNLGAVFLHRKQFQEAASAFRRVIALRPGRAEGHDRLGRALHQQGELGGAVDAYRRAISLQPNAAETWRNLAAALYEQNRYPEAIAAGQRTVAFYPNLAEVHLELGVMLAKAGRLEESESCCRRAVELKPNDAVAQNTLGFVLALQRKTAEATARYARALELNPDYPLAHWYQAMLFLIQGDFVRGWEEYEWRTKCDSFAPARELPQPRWMGEHCEGRTILLHADQGFGDTIQFVRYAPLVAERGAKVILECQPALCRLLDGFPAIEKVVGAGRALPEFDLHCPLLSLPRTLGFQTHVDCKVPYLRGNQALVADWASRLAGADSTKLKVGLAWAGNPRHTNDVNRSLALSQLHRLANDRVCFYSLQKGPAAARAASDAVLRPIDLTDSLVDFADTAALIENLDLVIAIDSSVAHLAGAMGKPVWLLLPWLPDWRWLLDRLDSPWYPTMRLFRQAERGRWEEPVERVAAELAKVEGYRVGPVSGRV